MEGHGHGRGNGLDLLTKSYGIRDFRQEMIENIASDAQCKYETKILNMESDLIQLQATVGKLMAEVQHLNSVLDNRKEVKATLKPVQTQTQPHTSSQRKTIIESSIKHLSQDEVEKFKKRALEKRSKESKPLAPIIVECVKCKVTENINSMFKVFDQTKGPNVVSYECANTKECYQREHAEDIQRKKDEKSFSDKYMHLPKEEQLMAMYGLGMEDIEEIPIRMRDASIHYQCIPNENDKNDKNDKELDLDNRPTEPLRLTWSWADKKWSSKKIN